MRLLAPALLLVSALTVAGLATTPAVAATAPIVSGVDVAGDGPGDLVRATGSGFDAAADVSVSLVGESGAVPLAKAFSTAVGGVTVPADTRIPLSTLPGSYRVTMTQLSGTTATSWPFSVSAPQVRMPASLQPGRPASLLDPSTTISVSGLSNRPGVVRTVAIDGVVTSAVQWSSDAGAFRNAGTAFSVPADLAVGNHEVTFTQTGETPYTATGTVPVQAPVITVRGPFPPTGRINLSIANTAWDEDFDVTIVGAAGDRHTDLHYFVTQEGGGYSTTTTALDVTGLSVGVATMTAVSRRNGATAKASFAVDGPTVTAPQGLAPGQRIISADGRTELVMQTDGNLVFAISRDPFWSTRTYNHPGARLAVQSDGNVVVYDVNGKALWNTGTAGIGAGVRVGFDAFGAFAVFTASGRQAWSTFEPFGGDLQNPLTANHSLFRGQSLSTNLSYGPGGALDMTMQPDGNLVVHGTDKRVGVLWSTHTAGHPNAYVVLQADGNLVLHAANGAVLWANYAKASGARLVAQSDGNVVEYASNGKAVWSTRTVVH